MTSETPSRSAFAERFFQLLAVALLFTLFLHQSRYLQRWDSAQFALGLEHLDVRDHQPHPPGYPLYIYCARLLQPLGWNDANRAFLLLNWLLTAGAAWAAFLLGTKWAGKLGGAICACFILASPLTRYYASVALSYPAGLCWFAWLGYSAWRVTRENDKRWWWPFVIAGIGGAFRLPTLVLGLPLLGYVWWKIPKAGKVIGPLLTAAIMVGAYLPVIQSSGGWDGWFGALASEGVKHETRFGRWDVGPLKELRDNWLGFKDYFWQAFLLPIPVVIGLVMGGIARLKKTSEPPAPATQG
ncbi:MAG: hypothetical protein ABI743_02025, partial [bacterium]